MIHTTCQGCQRNWSFTDEEASGLMEYYNQDVLEIDQCPLCDDQMPHAQYVGHA